MSLKEVNITAYLIKELISRNLSFQIPEELPQISASLESLINDEFGFSVSVKGVTFEKLNYLLSLLLNEPFQSEFNIEGELENSYSCKVSRCVAHLKKKSVDTAEILMVIDSDEYPAAVKVTTELVDSVTNVLEEVNGEISSLMKRLKEKSSNKEVVEEEFERLTAVLEEPLGKLSDFNEMGDKLSSLADDELNTGEIVDAIIKLDELKKKHKM